MVAFLTSLNRLKIVEEHLARELDILEESFKLNDEDVKKFYRWYMNHPYRKGIEELVEIVRRGKTNRKTETDSVKCNNNGDKEKSN